MPVVTFFNVNFITSKLKKKKRELIWKNPKKLFEISKITICTKLKVK